MVCKLLFCLLRSPAPVSPPSSPSLVLPLLRCGSAALPGAADSADPCGNLPLRQPVPPAPGREGRMSISSSRSEAGRLSVPGCLHRAGCANIPPGQRRGLGGCPGQGMMLFAVLSQLSSAPRDAPCGLGVNKQAGAFQRCEPPNCAPDHVSERCQQRASAARHSLNIPAASPVPGSR